MKSKNLWFTASLLAVLIALGVVYTGGWGSRPSVKTAPVIDDGKDALTITFTGSGGSGGSHAQQFECNPERQMTLSVEINNGSKGVMGAPRNTIKGKIKCGNKAKKERKAEDPPGGGNSVTLNQGNSSLARCAASYHRGHGKNTHSDWTVTCVFNK